MTSMKLPVIVCTLLLLLFSAHVPAASSPIPKAPSIASKGHILIDADTGKVLAEKNADERIGPASLTKIMTAYVVYSALDDDRIALDDEVVVSEKAWRMDGSRMFLEVGSTVTVDSLLDGMVIQSGNDASVSLAEHVAGSEQAFAELMNTYAERIGMDNTRFVNSHGMPAQDQYTTPRDIARLAQQLVQEFPDRYERYSQRQFSYNNIAQHNRNQLLYSDDTVDGIKTGYTADSGYHLASSAKRGDMRLISVVMGSPSVQQRTTDSRSMLNWGFRFFETHHLFDVGDTIETTRVWEGEADSLALGPAEDIVVTVARGEYDNLDATLSFPEAIVAPVAAGDEVARVEITDGEGETVVDVPAVALDDVERAGFIGRIIDRVRYWFEN